MCRVPLRREAAELIHTRFEQRLIKLVLSDLVADATPRETANLGASANMSTGFLQCPANVALFKRGSDSGEIRDKRLGQVNGKPGIDAVRFQ